jgi:hypothetical protein
VFSPSREAYRKLLAECLHMKMSKWLN